MFLKRYRLSDIRKDGKTIFSNGIVRSSLLMQLGVGMITLLIMFFYVNTIIIGNQKQRLCELNSSQLWRIGQDMDTRLEAIQDTATQILYSEDGISLMVNPQSVNSDAGRRMVNTLQRLAEENALIEKCYLYSPITDAVYSSAGNFLQLQNSAEESAVNAYLKIREKGRSGKDMITFRVFNYKGALYLVGDFCSPQFIGALITRMSIKEMLYLIQGEQNDTNFFLMDSSAKLLAASDEIAEHIPDTFSESECYNVLASEGDQESNYYYYHSPVNGLYYGLYLENHGSQVSFLTLLLTFLPFIFSYGLFTIVYALWVSRRLYQPINRLMKITFSQRETLAEIKKGQYRSEIDYLEEVFRDTWGENLQNRELLANISQDMQEQLFRGIVTGRNIDLDYLSDTMKGLGLEGYIQGRYQVIAGCIVSDVERELTSMEMGMYRRSLLNFIAEQETSDNILVAFFMDTYSFAVVLGFKEEVSALHIRDITTAVMDSMKKFAEQLPYDLLLGHGKVSNSIESIRSSYQDAFAQVEYMRYVSEDSEDSKIIEESKDYDRQYFLERGQKLAEAAEKEREEDAEELVRSIFKEMSAFSVDKSRSYAELVNDLIVEKMIAVHVDNSEINAFHSRMEKVMNDSSTPDWTDSIADVISMAVHYIHLNSRRSRYRYVDSAKEYISVHYSDGNLSLNEVSEAVGISAPYLSGIFSEAEQMGFSAYLNAYRVEQAKQFLEQTTTNMTEIGYKCGFNSAQSFNRVFKKITGFTPGQYRDYMKNKMKSNVEEQA